MSKNFIAKLQNEYVERNQEKLTFSVRLSVKQDLVLQEVADAYDLTRQEIIARLIDQEVVQAWEQSRELDKNNSEEVEFSERGAFYLLNTNSANDLEDHNWMISNQCAAAFEDGYKEKIQRIKAGDWVFLYASGKGIVAYGRATGRVLKDHHYGRPDKTFYQHLEHFKCLDTPIKAKEIKAILAREFPFAQTLACISDGQKLLDHINNV